MINTDLPEEYSKEIDTGMNIVYYNRTTNKSTKNHPNVFPFRQLFYKNLETKMEIWDFLFKKKFINIYFKIHVYQDEDNVLSEKKNIKKKNFLL